LRAGDRRVGGEDLWERVAVEVVIWSLWGKLGLAKFVIWPGWEKACFVEFVSWSSISFRMSSGRASKNSGSTVCSVGA
jgi:hypothetical protein